MAVKVVVNQRQLSEALAELRSYEGAEMAKRLRAATLAGAKSLKGPVSREGHYHNVTGRLRGSTKVVPMKVARQWVGYRVQVGGKGARQANIIIGGSKAHNIYGKVGKPLRLPFGARAKVHVTGVRADPYVARAGDENAETVYAAMAKSIARQRTKAGF